MAKGLGNPLLASLEPPGETSASPLSSPPVVLRADAAMHSTQAVPINLE